MNCSHNAGTDRAMQAYAAMQPRKQGKRLQDALNSSYVEAANRLRPRSARHRIVAYVESYDDVFFWRSVLQEFETEQYYFEVMLPSRTTLCRGKKTALMNTLGPSLGECMIACVDADYDWLMQGCTEMSRMVCSSPYVLHTYAYSIESFQCYAPSLHNVCVMATLNDRDIFNFEEYLRQYSEIIYELFVWMVWLHRRGRYNDFPLTNFNNIVSVEQLNVFKPIDALERVRKQVNRKLAWLQQHVKDAKGKLTPLKQELAELGVRKDNTYLFIQGHHLMENVVDAALTPVCTILRREREKDIKMLARGNSQQMNNELSCYSHSQFQPAQMLRRNTQYKDCDAYIMLRNQVADFLQRQQNKN